MKKRTFGRFSWPFRRRSTQASSLSLRPKRQRSLYYESLEERTLLATDVQIRLFFTDMSGNSLSSVQVGQEFLLRATVQDLTADVAGVASAYFNLSYDSDLASLSGTTVFHSDDYSITSGGTNVLAEGSLTAVGGEAASSDSLSSPEDPLTLFSVELVAASSGELNFTVTEASLSDAIQLFVADSTDLTTVSFDNVDFAGADYSENISITVTEAGPAVYSFERFLEEGTTPNFLAKDFSQNFLDLVEGESDLQYVMITALPTTGELTFGGASVTVDQVISVDDLADLVYAPAADAEVYSFDTFSWTGSANGTDYAEEAATATLIVTETESNMPPYYLASISKSVSSGSTLTFTGAEFDNVVIDYNLGDALETVTVTDLPDHGTLYLDGTAVTVDQEIPAGDLDGLTYISSSSYTGSDSFSWIASDGDDQAASDSTVALTIMGATGNQAPTVSNSSKSVDEDETLAFSAADFTGCFNDADGDALQTVKISALPSHGTLYFDGTAVTVDQELGADALGSLSYEPGANYNGADSFDWVASDGTTDANSAATVTITVSAVNDTPTVDDLAVSVDEDGVLSFANVDASDYFSDIDGDALQTVKILSLPSHGTLQLGGTAVTADQEIDAEALSNLTYQPEANYNGADSFEWVASDGTTYAESEASVNITVSPVNDAPTVDDLAVSVEEDGVLSFANVDSSNSFSDIDGDALQTVKILSLPSHGTLYLDGTTVTLNQEIAAADIDALTYEPEANYNGTDSFDWVASDGTAYAETEASVNITITAVDDATTASSFSRTIVIGATYTFTLEDFADNFSDPDSDASLTTVKIVSLPSYGTLLLDGQQVAAEDEIDAADIESGLLTYTSTSEDSATDSIGWNATNGEGYAESDVVAVFSAVEDVPVVSDFGVTVDEDETFAFSEEDFNEYFSDYDPDHSLQTAKIVSLPSYGTLYLDSVAVTAGQELDDSDLDSLTYVPNDNYHGEDSFEWLASDGTTYADSEATVTITVSAVNDAPTVSDFAVSTDEGAAFTFSADDFSDGFSDIDDDTLQTVKITTLPSQGTLYLDGEAVTEDQEIDAADLGSLTYEPDDGYSGTDTFAWTGSDGTAYASTERTTTITVAATDGDNGSISGSVYLDADNDGARSSSELGLPGVVVQLLQEDSDGVWTSVALAMTDSSGNFSFTGLSAGTYKLVEAAQPSNYVDGVETAGSLGGTTGNDSISDIVLDAGDAGTGYLFGETALAAKVVGRWLFVGSTPSRTEIITSLNKAPTVDLNGSATSGTSSSASFTSGDDAIAIASSATITDADGGWLKSMTVTITNRQDGDSELLAAVTTDTGIAASYAGGVLTLTGVASLANYQTVLRSITYENTASSPIAGDRTITVVVFDGITGTGTSESATATVSVDGTGTDSTTPTAEVTTSPPTIATADADESTTTVTITYSDDNEIDTGSFATTNIQVDNGATVSGLSYQAATGGYAVTYTITAPEDTWGESAQGTYTISLVADEVLDLAGNSAAAISSLATFTVDTVAPTVTINQKSTQSDPTTGSTVYFTVVFSEEVTGFDESDVNLDDSTTTGDLAATVTDSGDGMTYTVAVTGMTSSGQVIASIDAGVATDDAGNENTASTSDDNSVNYNETDLTVTINQASTQADPTYNGTIHFTVVFSQSVSDFATGDVTLGGTAGGTLVGTITGSGTTYDVAVTGMTSTGTVIASIAAGVAEDADGNANSASTSTDNIVTYDITGPAVTINQASSQSDATNDDTIYFTVVFSEEVSGFTADDVTLASSAGDTLAATVTDSGDGVTYTVAVTGMSANGTVTASIASDVAEDAAGNANSASTSDDNVVTYDVASPMVTIDQASTQADPTANDTVYFTVVFSETVSGFTADDVTLTSSVGDTLTATVTDSGDGATYTVAVTGITGSGTVTASIAAGVAEDAAGNTNEASTSTDNVVTYDVDPPAVTITQASTQDDPTNNSTIYFTVVFSEEVNDFATGDVTVGGTAGGSLVATVTGSGATYDVAVTGMTSSGTVIVSIAAGVAEDAAGNGNEVATSTDNVVTYDVDAPAVTINQANTQEDPTSDATIYFTVVFSEEVSGFTADDVALTSSIGDTLAATVTDSGDGTTYTVEVTGMTDSSTVAASIAAGAAQDAAGNVNEDATSTDNEVEYTAAVDQVLSQEDFWL